MPLKPDPLDQLAITPDDRLREYLLQMPRDQAAQLRLVIDRHIREARAEERERCAKVAEEKHEFSSLNFGEEIAATIRALK